MNILVIGAAGGIGTSLVNQLNNLSANLFLGYHQNKIDTNHPHQQVDARNFESTESFVQKGLDELGSVDGVVNLAGNLILKPAHLSTDEDFSVSIETNLKTAFSVVKAVGSNLKDCSVVLMSTAAASIGLANHELISSAKSGVEGLAISAAKTYARKNIRFNTVSPGLVDTPLAEKITSNELALNASKKMHGLQRIGRPDDIAGIISYLVNPDNNWITGQNFVIDGGLSSIK